MEGEVKASEAEEKKRKSQVEEIDRLMEYIESGGSLGLELEKLFDELPEKYAVLVLTRHEKYNLLIANLVKNFRKKGMDGIFVTLNKDGKDLLEMLQKNKVDCNDFFVVDAISRGGSKITQKTANISYVDSPQDLTEMEAQIADFIEKTKQGKRFFILDNLSTLFIYNSEKTVEKFVHSLSEKLRSLGFQAVFTLMEGAKPEIMNVMSQFFEKVIKPSPQISP